MRGCSFLVVVLLSACGDSNSERADASAALDAAGGSDAGNAQLDAGRAILDAGPQGDGGAAFDAALIDASVIDASVIDASVIDASVIDASVIDASVIDASVIDASVIDASVIDASVIDASPSVMTFFVTSSGSGASGGDLGGLAGADAKCQALGAFGGAGTRTWRAYLSTWSATPADIVHAKDRIGAGPWVNHQGVLIASNLADLHANGILGAVVLDELGNVVPGNEHDILTGSGSDGMLYSSSTTCGNWTDGTTLTQGQVGHCDVEVGDGESWNSQHSGSCDEAALNGNAGTGRLYCFAID